MKSKKVVLMGLDDSGKSSIVLSLEGVKNLPAFTQINPTKNMGFLRTRTIPKRSFTYV